MQSKRFEIDGPVVFTPKRHGDDRGFFSEVFRQDVVDAALGAQTFVQDNHSFSARRGTLRGLHYQSPPAAQGKLLRVARGAVFDVAVDIRKASPTYGRYVGLELSAANGELFWIPPGFLHGFCTLTDGTDFLYKVTHYYSHPNDGAVIWNDPDIGITWPLPTEDIMLSSKDAQAPRLRDLPPIF
ncbi:MAG: dTDP-4-dehydrorhamnose 3,5-epimerase [Rhizobiales bacterium PAR1]|nr:MAG: dTDP-4-dehydrorhamnose 3,5-epimerase [Rhizobiales bacterium PAR1]